MNLRCLACQKAFILIDDAQEKKCPACGSGRVEELSNEIFKKAYDAGAIYDIDPRTGGRAKKRR
ncbi:hypothetical protein AWB80_08178 [Caballeronia pedi]|uniref:Uncharacterized protein n=1 Tax=Caballeronia pedi TaxID=1777141 RepID=A0A158E4C4_9BURK|nr:zinc ribbon domain-containing protein [Caballeronia pedi]SAL01654.1 hypothetical protein AWB80_08178 [Caballeronia pedi]